MSNLIPTDEAWKRIAKALLPNEKIRDITERDAWLINRYFPPWQTEYFGGDDRVQAPKDLIAEVDRAYFRLSLRERVEAWFAAEGFDLEAEMISRSDFDARLAAVKVDKPRKDRIRSSRVEMQRWVRDYLQTPNPTVTGARAAWSETHGASGRQALDAEVHAQAAAKGIALKPGKRPNKPAKI